MILSVPKQVKLFVLSIIIGSISRFVYDLVKVLRRLIKHNIFFIHVEDFIYWLIISSATFFIMLRVNLGEIRNFCICGAFVGMLIYSLCLSNLITSFIFNLVSGLIKIITSLIKIILYPVRLIIKFLSYPARYIIKFLNKNLVLIKKYTRASKRYAKIKSMRTRESIRILFKKS